MGNDTEASHYRELEEARAEVERASRHYYGTELQKTIDNRTKTFVIERCQRFLKGPHVLELGYVDGLWSERIVTAGFHLDIVEGATSHVEHARLRFAGHPDVRVFHALFQEFEPADRYDTVIAGDIVRYLADATGFLIRAAGWMKSDGRLIVTVPNSRSLHRRIGALMDLEPTPAHPNQRDREVGNRRAYDRYELRQLLRDSGFEVEHLGGCFLKPLSSAQMQDWSDDLLRAFLAVGDELQDYCWFLYAVCRKRG